MVCNETCYLSFPRLNRLKQSCHQNDKVVDYKMLVRALKKKTVSTTLAGSICGFRKEKVVLYSNVVMFMKKVHSLKAKCI